MNPELLSLIAFVVVAVVSCAVVYLAIKAMDSRPDIVALFSLIAIASGLLSLMSPDFNLPINGAMVVMTGVFFLFYSAFTYNSKRGVS